MKVEIVFAVQDGPAALVTVGEPRVPTLGEWVWKDGDWWRVDRVLWNDDGVRLIVRRVVEETG